jgi:protein-S-isoprenylcysteine O-methyltransferase Ste14
MDDNQLNKPKTPEVRIKKSIKTFLIRFVGLFIILIALLFIPAGRLDWWEAWLFVLVYAIFIVVYLLRGLRKDPGQINERSQTGKNVKSWDKIILGIYTILLLVMFIVAGLDAGRYRWAPIPFFLEIFGWLGLVLAGSLIWWTASVNTFLSRQVRIQEERGHHAVTSGPYRFVRHPMYDGIILFVFCIPLILGSAWALIPAGAITVLFIIRTTLEDKTLREELTGYREYAEKVRYRLLPRIW